MPELKREQREVINHGNGNILVSASAGSGKTFVMIQRLIRLIVEKKTSVKEVLCVTFTEAAALEMKLKLKKALAEKIAEGVDLSEELLSVDTADICTIHSFCSRLIRKYFFIAGVAPDYKIAEETRADLLINESINETFSTLYKQKEKSFLELLKRHGKNRSNRTFKELVIDVHKFLQVDADPEKYVENSLKIYSDVEFAVKKYKEYILITLNNLREYCNDIIFRAKGLEFDNAIKIVSQLARDLDVVIYGDLYDVKRFEEYKISQVFGSKIGDEKEAIKAEVKKLCSTVASTFKRINKHISDRETDAKKGLEIKEHLEKLFAVVKLFGEIYAEKKREENVLDFADLEHFALRILRDEESLKTIKAGYKYVFADEYQDVNGVQEEILSRVSNNNLFMVGDVKQSIYGFRGCRPEIFEEKEKKMRALGEKTVRLNHNFRSANGVIDAVNDIFSYSMTEALYGADYAGTAKLIGGGIYPEEARGQTSLYLLDKEKDKNAEKILPKIYNLLEEASKTREDYPSNIALLIEKIIKKELGKKYYDTKSQKEKNITYSDIVILNKNRDNEYIFTLVSDLLRLNVPVSSSVSENVLAYPEIQLLVSILKLIDCKKEDIPLVSVLKSPVGNFTEEELLKIALLYKDYLETLDGKERKRRNFYSAYKYALQNIDGEILIKLKKFDEYVENARLQADFFGAGKMLERVIIDSGLENYLIVKGNAREKLARISFFIKKATEDKIYTVHEFLRLIENSPKSFQLSPTTGDDSVRVMTIHASKGLEFPVVIVCGLEKGVNRRPQSAEVLKDYQLGLCLKNYDDENKILEENLFRGLFKEKMKADKIKEDLRLFYVATTRASYSMHLTFEASTDIRRGFFVGADKFVDYLPRDMAIEEISPEDICERVEERRGKRSVLVGKVSEEEASIIENNLSYSYPFESCTTLPIKCSVTKALVNSREGGSPVHVIVSEEETGVERGIIAHKILEHLSFDALFEGKGFFNQIEDMVGLGILTESEATSVDLARLELAVMGFAERLKGKKLYREHPFLARIDGEKVLGKGGDEVLVQGIIDLLAIGEDGAEIIDYKYSVLSGESLRKKYAVQLELYSLAVQKVLKVKSTKKTLVNLLSGELVDF